MDVIIAPLRSALLAAAAAGRPVDICGGGSKRFYGNPGEGDALDVTPCHGILSYEPTELVITARAGTPLAEIESAMREQGQMLGFEPPHFGGSATLGGCIATGLSGPRRPWAGAARDFVLGMRILDGRGNDLRFGGQVMKNVAGYDVSRLMTGSLGTLGIILEVSLKALPLPPAEITVRLDMNQADALQRMNGWAAKPLPITASCHVDGQLFLRLSGAATAVKAAADTIGGEPVEDGDMFWQQIRDHRHRFFDGNEDGDAALWRLSLRSTSPPLDLKGDQLLEWNGSLRWLRSTADAGTVRRAAAAHGGHATLFRPGANGICPDGAFHPLPDTLMRLHRRVKSALDPDGIFNAGRLYPGL